MAVSTTTMDNLSGSMKSNALAIEMNTWIVTRVAQAKDWLKKNVHTIFTIKRFIVPSTYGLVHDGRSSRKLVGGSRYPATPLYGEWAL